MTNIERDPQALRNERFDVVVIGGGIYGACMLLEASRRGLRALLVERDDFGGHTSWNSLRIVHGGLRYLQTADFARFRRSVAEQAWWLREFPDLVKPLPCLMPLYNRGLRRTGLMRAALSMNDVMARPIRRRVAGDANLLESGGIIDAKETLERFPAVNADGLRGGATWCDAYMESPQRLLVEVLRWANAAGGKSLNYMKCTGLLSSGDVVSGIQARCSLTGDEYEFLGRTVINCAGPWSRLVAAGVASERKDYARAFNVVVACKPFSRSALALTPKAINGKPTTWFAVPYRGQMIIGTAHLPPGDDISPTASEVQKLLDEVNRTVTELPLTLDDVLAVLPGRLPAATNGSHFPGKSPRIRTNDGLRGLTSVEGVKYTTARHVAQQTLAATLGSLPDCQHLQRPLPLTRPTLDETLSASDLQKWIAEESVQHVDDLIFRRQDPLHHIGRLNELGKQLVSLTGMDAEKQQQELQCLENTLACVRFNTDS